MSGTQAHHAGGTRARIGRAATGVVSSAAQFGSDRADIADSMGHTAAEMAGRAGMYGMSSTMHGVGWTAAVDWAYRLCERQGGGHLVVITSGGGLRGGGAAPAYNASKAYQINYAEGLRQLAAKSGLPLPVTDIRPGFVATEMAKGEGLVWVMPVDRVVEGIVRAIRRRRSVAVVTRRWRIVAWLIRHMPECIYRKMG